MNYGLICEYTAISNATIRNIANLSFATFSSPLVMKLRRQTSTGLTNARLADNEATTVVAATIVHERVIIHSKRKRVREERGDIQRTRKE